MTTRFKSFAKFQADNEAISLLPWRISLFRCSLWAFMMNFSSLLVPQCIWTIAILGELTQTCLLLHLFRNVLRYVLCIHRDDNVFIWDLKDHFQIWFWSIDISGSWLKRKHSKGHGCFVNAYNSLYGWEVEIWERKLETRVWKLFSSLN